MNNVIIERDRLKAALKNILALPVERLDEAGGIARKALGAEMPDRDDLEVGYVLRDANDNIWSHKGGGKWRLV